MTRLRHLLGVPAPALVPQDVNLGCCRRPPPRQRSQRPSRLRPPRAPRNRGALRGDEYPTVGEQGILGRVHDLTAAFPNAKVVDVGSSTEATAAGGGESVKKDPEAAAIPKGGDNLSPEEAQKQSKKIPDKVQSEGKPPAKDNKASGGGSEATEIG